MPGPVLPADYALAVDGEFAAAGRSRTARSGAVPPPLSFSCISIASPTAPPARNLRMVPPTAAPRGLRSRPFAGEEKPRAGTFWLSRMPEPVMDGLKPPSNGGVQVAGLRRQVVGPMNSAVGSVADDVVDLERCPVCCAQPVDEDPPVGQPPRCSSRDPDRRGGHRCCWRAWSRPRVCHRGRPRRGGRCNHAPTTGRCRRRRAAMRGVLAGLVARRRPSPDFAVSRLAASARPVDGSGAIQ